MQTNFISSRSNGVSPAVAPSAPIKQTGDLARADNAGVRRVLIYRLGSLGDTIVALPALHLVARAFPNAERRLLTNMPVSAKAPAAAAVLGNHGLVHGHFLYSAGVRDLRQLASLWWRLLRWRPQLVVYLAASRGQKAVLRDSRFFRFCGVRRQIGVPITAALQQNLPIGDEQVLEPEAARLARNLAELGDARLDDPESWSLRLTAAEMETAKEVLGPLRGMPVIAVSVGTKMQSKDWGGQNWHALLHELAQGYPRHALVLCGARDEFAASEAAAEGWRRVSPSPGINLCGRLTPRESAAVLAECSLFIGHDSGPMHLAAAVQTPCVAIFAARNKPRIWFPYGRQHRVIYHKVDCWGCGLETCVLEKKKCITSISVSEVLAAVREVLASE